MSDAGADVVVRTHGKPLNSTAKIDIDAAVDRDAVDDLSSAEEDTTVDAEALDSYATVAATAELTSEPVAETPIPAPEAVASTTRTASRAGAADPVESTGSVAEHTDEAVAEDMPTADALAVPQTTPAPPAVQPVKKQTQPAGESSRVVAGEPPPAAASGSAPAAPAPKLGGFLELLFREIERTFFNKTPTLAYNSLENTIIDGRVEGNVNASDPDSEVLTFVATDPASGTVEMHPDGSFTYTPGPDYTGHDTFNVTVSDAGNGFQLHGIPALIHLLTFGLFGSDGHTRTATINIGFQRTVVASGLNKPVDFGFLPDGGIIVAENDGAIKLVSDDEQPSLPVVDLPVSRQGPQGISGIELDPDFQNNGYLYVAYTTDTLRNRLSRITVTDGGSSLDSELVLLEADGEIGGHHHGGGLEFGPDGMLYWGLGDNNTPTSSQDLSTLHGKIVRIHADGTVPDDNPFGNTGALPQIYAYGVRNPFRFGFAPDGTFLVADVGQDTLEELNNVTAGGNYGWPNAEGPCTDCSSVNPIYTYPHSFGAAVSAVLVPNGSTFGAGNDGKVFIADFIQGWIKVLTCSPGYSSCGSEKMFDPQAGSTVKLSQGPDGNIYQLTFEPGVLTRISPS